MIREWGFPGEVPVYMKAYLRQTMTGGLPCEGWFHVEPGGPKRSRLKQFSDEVLANKAFEKIAREIYETGGTENHGKRG